MGLIDFITSRSGQATHYGNLYIKSSEKYVKLKIFEQLSITVSLVVKLLVICGFAFIGALFLAITTAIALGKLLGGLVWGALVVALLFFLFAALVYGFRQKIDNAIVKKLSTKFFETDDEQA
ncbi:MAG: hypothetical protein ACK5NB_11295 [Flavobacteriaceae bacterium]